MPEKEGRRIRQTFKQNLNILKDWVKQGAPAADGRQHSPLLPPIDASEAAKGALTSSLYSHLLSGHARTPSLLYLRHR